MFCFAIADRLESFVLEIIFPLLGLHPFREAAGFGPHYAQSGEPNATFLSPKVFILTMFQFSV
jgi:hypothetical protein